MKHATFDGGWLDLREPHEITNGGRRSIRSAKSSVAGPLVKLIELVGEELGNLGLPDDVKITDEQMMAANAAATIRVDFTPDQWDRMQRLNDVALVATIKAWSIPGPVSLDTLDELPADLVDKIEAAGAALASRAIREEAVDLTPEVTEVNGMPVISRDPENPTSA